MCHALSGARQAAHHHLSDHPMPGTRYDLHVSDSYCLSVPPPHIPRLLTGSFFLFVTWVSFETWKNVLSLSSLVLISIRQNLPDTEGGGSRKIIESHSAKSLQHRRKIEKQLTLSGRMEKSLDGTEQGTC